MLHRNKKVKKVCVEFGCENFRYTLGRCMRHALTLDPKEKARLSKMSRKEREAEFAATLKVSIPHFEYEGNEEALIAMVEQQEQKEKANA